MPKPKYKLRWIVFYYNVNKGSVERWNVFENYRFVDDCIKARTKCKDDKEGFLKAVKSSLMYYYWSKAEWEIVIYGFFRDVGEQKVDVYDQVMLNWEIFSEYIWNNRKDL